MGVPEAVEYMLRSEERIRIMDALGEEPKRQAAIARECSVARSTVHRNVQGLERRGWVREDGDGYALTAVGERILSTYRSFAGTVGRLDEYEPVFRCFEDMDVSLPTEAVVDAEVVTPTAGDPHAPAVAIARTMRNADADRIRVLRHGISPITGMATMRYLSGGRTMELVVDRETIEVARDSYYKNYQITLASDRVDLHVTREEVEFGMVVTGDEVGVVGYADDQPSACLVGSADALREWADRVYRRWRSCAAPVEVKYPLPRWAREVRDQAEACAETDHS